MSIKYPYRITTEISVEMRKKLDSLPYGVKRLLIVTLLEEFFDLYEKDERVLYAIITKEIKGRELLESLKGRKSGNKK